MRKITRLGVATFLVSCLIYLIPQWSVIVDFPDNVWRLKKEIVLFSGTVAWMFMSLAIVLSLRLPSLESATDGLDKGFVLHKWSGVIALVTGVLHWLTEIVPKWLVQQNWITPPLKTRRMTGGTPEWPVELASMGQTIAEWAIYVLIVLCIISLSKKIPYYFFRYTHKIFPLVYLAITFHVLTVLAKTSWWSTPSSWIIVIVSAFGTIASFISLFQRIGKKRSILATVVNVERYPSTIDITLKMDKPVYYRSGQFAFVRFGGYSEAHPYTIASSPDNPSILRFVIKALGDDTRRLVDSLNVGEKAVVEGPYGRTDFGQEFERQIWIAGGIGITPFISRLTELAQQGGTVIPVDLWYCGREKEPKELSMLCRKAKVQLYTVNTRSQARLSSNTILQTISPGEKVGVWFCGPASFGYALRRDMKKNSVPLQYDNFSLR